MPKLLRQFKPYYVRLSYFLGKVLPSMAPEAAETMSSRLEIKIL